MNIELLGMPKGKVSQFEKKGIQTLEQLVQFFPRKYYDFRKIVPISQLKDEDVVAVVGTIQELKFGVALRAKIMDDSRRAMYVVWFQQGYLRKKLKVGDTYIFCGKIEVNEQYHTTSMISPFFFGQTIEEYQRIIPVYSKIQGMSDDFLQKSVNAALALVDKTDYLEPLLKKKFDLVDFTTALKEIHQPQNDELLKKAQDRFLFDDLFYFNMQLIEMQEGLNTSSTFTMPRARMVKTFMETLSFDLTEGQRLALRRIFIKMRNKERVNVLVQGDVGCGKTIVAILLMLVTAENGHQSVLMAPTNVLAYQHYMELLEKTKNLPIKIGYLSGDMKTKEKREVLKQIESGEIQIVVGTHAVIQKDVKFKSLALTVVDEEHRFGVNQRNALKDKAKEGVHHIAMSATPIPRSLALTMYGEGTEVVTITTMPKGRKPVKTILYGNEEKTYVSMYNQIKQGRQCYVVCPLIEDSSSEALANVDSVETTYAKMTKWFSRYPEIKIGVVTGKNKDEIKPEIEKFVQNKTQIIIATTVIEVGVNVPNASVILIKSAERFGLSQLHQLRGRVGRGEYQSYCVLLSKDTRNLKLQAMTQTNDGFKIAEKDLELRGAGDFIGVKQSGENKYIVQMLAHPELNEVIQKEVRAIYSDKARIANYHVHLEAIFEVHPIDEIA